MKRVRIGGQAVMEGVMMKNGDRYAVAVRKPDKDIEVKVVDYVSMASRSVFFRVPIIRGVVNFVESLVIGVKTLTYSASFYDDEEPEKAEKEKKEKKKNKLSKKRHNQNVHMEAFALTYIHILLNHNQPIQFEHCIVSFEMHPYSVNSHLHTRHIHHSLDSNHS